MVRALTSRRYAGSIASLRAFLATDRARAGLAGGSQMMAIAVRIASTLIVLPVIAAHYDTERFGLWLTALSLIGLIGFFQSGLAGNAVTAIGRHSGTPDDLRAVVATLLVIAAGVGVLVGLAGAALVTVLDLHGAFGLSTAVTPGEVDALCLTFVGLVASGFVASVPKYVLIGSMRGSQAHLMDLLGIALGAIGLVVAALFGAPLAVLALALTAPQQLASLAIGGWLIRHAIGRRPRPDRRRLWPMARDAGRLSVAQAATAAAQHTDLLIITLILSVTAAVPYGIAQRLFGLPVMAIMVIMEALWPVISRAAAAGNQAEVRRIVFFGLALALAGSLAAAAALAAWHGPLVRLWMGEAVPLDPLLVAGMAASIVATVLSHAGATVLKSLGHTALLMRTMVVMAAVNVPLSVVLVWQIGAAGAVWGTVISVSLCLLVPYIRFIGRLLRETKQSGVRGAEAAGSEDR